VKYISPPASTVTLGGYAAKQCHERTRKELDIDVDAEWKDPIDPFSLSIMEAGNVYEDPVIRGLFEAAIPSHVVIDTTKRLGKVTIARELEAARAVKMVIFTGDREPASLAAREELTHALLEDPGSVRILWNPRLRKWKKDGHGKLVWASRSAEPDVLYRQNARAARTSRWGSIDVKFHHPFSGTTAGIDWLVSTLDAPFPEKGEKRAFTGTLKREDAYQLAHYHRALEFHGLAGSAVGGIIGKPLDDETLIVWLDLNDKLYERNTASALSMYDSSWEKVLAVATREMERREDPTLPKLSFPEWKSECGACEWRSLCHIELAEMDSITLLPGITPTKAQAHYEAGVNTTLALSKLDTATARLVEAKAPRLGDLVASAQSGVASKDSEVHTLFQHLDPPLRGVETSKLSSTLAAAGIETVAAAAKLDLATARYAPGVKNLVKAIDQARVVTYGRVHRNTHVFKARGVGELTIPSAPVEVHVDMENDAHIYMWGVCVVWTDGDRVRTTRESFHSFDATDESEARVVAEFWAYLTEIIQKAVGRHGADGVRVFHYTAAEDRCLRHLANKHIGVEGVPTPGDVEAFLASDVWVDLYPILTNQLIWPTEDQTLKSLAKYVRFLWRDEDPSGSNSVVWYQRACDPTDPEREAWQKRIIDYNADDCAATAALLAWLQRFGQVTNPNRTIEPVENLEPRARRPR